MALLKGKLTIEVEYPAELRSAAADFFFFTLAKAHRGGQDAETCPPRRAQRNCGRLTAGRLTEKGKYPFFAPSLLCAPHSFFFSQRRRDLPAVGRPARRGGRKEIVVRSLRLSAAADWLCAFPIRRGGFFLLAKPCPLACGRQDTKDLMC